MNPIPSVFKEERIALESVIVASKLLGYDYYCSIRSKSYNFIGYDLHIRNDEKSIFLNILIVNNEKLNIDADGSCDLPNGEVENYQHITGRKINNVEVLKGVLTWI
ncbi:hypothetical protein D3C75_627260 [compost metagenome]